MNLYFDDNLLDKALVAMLQKAGHHVVLPKDVNLTSASDARHLEHAIGAGLVLMTKDSEDFEDLHQLVLTCGGRHFGIIVVRFDNDPRKDMKPKHIVAAIAKLESSGLTLDNQFVILNHWR